MEKQKKERSEISIWHSILTEDVFSDLSSKHEGLSRKEVERRLEKYGPNEISDDDKNNPVLIFLKQFKSGLVYILIAAGIISALFGKMIDAYVILAVLLLNAVMGFVQEYKAEKAIKALKRLIVPTVKVYREGTLFQISAKTLVPGDIIFLEEGDRIPADARLFYTKDFRTSEASLTGESVPVGKDIEILDKETDLADRKNMIWMGTFVAGGKAKAVVVATGKDTVFGTIASDIKHVEKKGGHFEEKIGMLSRQMAIFAFSGALIIFTLSLLFSGISINEIVHMSEGFRETLLFSIAALVSGIPEGLPAILVILLAIGATRMAKRNAIIRKLPATETLGVTDHIVTDKTGTLTKNTMNVRSVLLSGEDEVRVTGEGWNPYGEFYIGDQHILPLRDSRLEKLLYIAGICNDAKLTKDEDEKDRYKIIGDPTEAALVVLAEKAGIKEEILIKEQKKVDDMPFNSKLKYRASLSVLLEDENNKQLYVVGAPEEVIKNVTHIEDKQGVRKISSAEKKKMLLRVNGLTDKAMRTIALAYKPLPKDTKEISYSMAKGLTLVGVVGMMDPPREEVKDAVEKAYRAGIRVVMITGDHKGTALAIAKETGIIKEGREKALTEKELLKMSEKQFETAVKDVDVFARTTPHMKLKIAKCLQEKHGAVVAMTGDGVNDAPAIKQADIGIAMGISGTDVTKEAGEIILADDNFASIISAIEEGRIVFTNTRQTTSFLVTTNIAEDIVLIISVLLRFPLPLIPTQILWLNLITDSVAGFPLAVEPGHGNILNRPPRDKKENILSAEIIPFFILMTAVMAVLSILVFNTIHEGDASLGRARAGVFTIMAFTQLFNAINMRSIRESVFKIGFFSNKYLILALLFAVILQLAVIEIPFFQNVFGFGGLTFKEIISLIGLSSSVFIFAEIYKYFRYR